MWIWHHVLQNSTLVSKVLTKEHGLKVFISCKKWKKLNEHWNKFKNTLTSDNNNYSQWHTKLVLLNDEFSRWSLQ